MSGDRTSEPSGGAVPAEPVPAGAGFDVRPEWKELLVYSEGQRRFVFDAAWGGTPTAYVPDEATWDDVVPDWLRGRREEVVDRVRRYGAHLVVATDTGYPHVDRLPD